MHSSTDTPFEREDGGKTQQRDREAGPSSVVERDGRGREYARADLRLDAPEQR